MRIGILTGGGDVPGLNPCIKAAVYRAIDEGHEMVGIRRGWGGLLKFNPDDPKSMEEHVILLDKQNTRTIDRSGGMDDIEAISGFAEEVTKMIEQGEIKRCSQLPERSKPPRSRSSRQVAARLHSPCIEESRVPGHRRADSNRRRRHTLLWAAPPLRGLPSRGDPQDDGQ